MGVQSEMNYAVVIDAGSSGSRVHIYRWPDPSTYSASLSRNSPLRSSLLPIEADPSWVTKIRPGLSSFAGSASDVCTDHIQPLIDAALKVVPARNRAETPLFLLATAGMRLLSEEDRNEILDRVCGCLQASPFYVPECETHATMIDGMVEGLYGWLGLNYLVHQSLDSKWEDFSSTYGFLDMGGASAQIAFAPDDQHSEEHANDLYTVRVRTVSGDPVEWRLFVTTWLGFGANESQQRLREKLLAELSAEDLEPAAQGAPVPVQDPCMPIGATDLRKQKDVEYLFYGNGDYDACSGKVVDLLNTNAECTDKPCLFDGKHVPGFGDFSAAKFIGVSEYWYTLQDIFKNEGKYDYRTLEEKVRALCSGDWHDVKEQYSSISESNLQKACFKSAWVLTVLDKGFNFPLDSGNQDGDHNFEESFQSAIYIQGAEISWTMGRAILYASSQIESQGASVGFQRWGEDFVLGGEVVASPPPTDLYQPDSRKWAGVILFAVLFGLAAWIVRTFIQRIPRLRRTGWSTLYPNETELPVVELNNRYEIPLHEIHGGLSTGLPVSNVPSRVASRVSLHGASADL